MDRNAKKLRAELTLKATEVRRLTEKVRQQRKALDLAKRSREPAGRGGKHRSYFG